MQNDSVSLAVVITVYIEHVVSDINIGCGAVKWSSLLDLPS